MAYAYKLTKKGRETVSRFIRECKAFRKEILDGRKDTADSSQLITGSTIRRITRRGQARMERRANLSYGRTIREA